MYLSLTKTFVYVLIFLCFFLNFNVYSSNKKILTQLNLLWGVKAFHYNNFKSTDKTIEEINKIALNMGYIQKKDLI